MPQTLIVLNSLLLLNLFVHAFESSLVSEQIFVGDNLFTYDDFQRMKSLFSREESPWTYRQRGNTGSENLNTQLEDEEGMADVCFSWSTQLNSLTFMDLSAWSTISSVLTSRLKLILDDWNVKAHAVEGFINTRGSQTCSSRFNDDDANRVNFTAIVFLVEKWGRNDYGELIVYDKGEIMQAVHPRKGRLVMMPASLEHVIKPPSINKRDNLYILKIHVKVTKRNYHERELSEERTERVQELEDAIFQKLFPTFDLLTDSSADNDSPARQKLDPEKFVTRKFTTNDGHVIVVLDDILPRKEVDALSRTVYTSGYSDNPPSQESVDNVYWIMSFEVEHFVKKSLWRVLSQIVTYVSGSEGYYPYDIGCNNIQRGDMTTIHQDCAEHENEFTLLIYLNHNWTGNHHGETVFFSDMKGSEVIYAVRPRYGRVLIFNGIIPHSARPPPLTHAGARFSFAIKMSASKEIALKKSLILELDVLYEVLQKLHGIEAENLRRALTDISEGKMEQEEIQELLHHYQEKYDL